jgi:hypothetical protein
MDKLSYDEIFKNILSITGNELSNIEQTFLLFHAIFLKHNFIYKENRIIDGDWNKEYGKAVFEYTFKNAKVILELKKDPNANNILISLQSKGPNNNNVNINTTIREDDEKITKINFENLNDSIIDSENFVKSTYIEEVKNSLSSGTNSNSNFNVNYSNYEENRYFRSGGEVDPNRLLITNINQGGYNPIPNPYFSTGGGSVGGNLVGPTSDIFTGHMFPQPMPGIHPTIRYDPIGPFGTFGGPPKKNDKTTDPFRGGNPFGSGFPPNGKGPFGGNPFG